MRSALGWIAGLINQLTRSLSAFRAKAAVAWRVMRCATIPIVIQRGEDIVIVVKGTGVGRGSQAGGSGRAQAQGGKARRQAVRETRITEVGTLTFTPYRPEAGGETPEAPVPTQAGAAVSEGTSDGAVPECRPEEASTQVSAPESLGPPAAGRRLVMIINQTAGRR